MLTECIDYLENSSRTYEIIIVSDGSTDETVKVANKLSEKLGTNKLRVLELETNRGKGGAVRLVSYICFYCSILNDNNYSDNEILHHTCSN